MILWYHQIWPKVDVRLMDTNPRTKTKTIPLRKIRVCLFLNAVYRSKNHVILHRVIAAILDVILNILQR